MKPLTLAAWNRLATLYPDTLMVGMELREKVSTYVKERIGEEGGIYSRGRGTSGPVSTNPAHSFQGRFAESIQASMATSRASGAMP